MIDKPDPVGRLVKPIAVLVHLPGSDPQDGYRTAPGTHFPGGVQIRGKMDIETPSFYQPPLQDRREKALRCSMVEFFGRDSGFQFEVNGDGMSLAGPDLKPIRTEMKPLLFVCFHDSKQLNPVDFQAFPAAPDQEAIDIRPSLGIQIQPDRLRFMTEDQAEELSVGSLESSRTRPLMWR